MKWVSPFQPSVAFHLEISHLICTANQVTGFYMKCNTGLKWVNLVLRSDFYIIKSIFATGFFLSWEQKNRGFLMFLRGYRKKKGGSEF